MLYSIIEKFSDTSLLAEKDGKRYILKYIQPSEREVYDKLLIVKNENIANITDIIQMGSGLFAVREYICGLPLAEYVFKFGKFSDEDIKNITAEICDGLSAVHAVGIVHRDITPSNIIIDETGKAKIIDFGISRISKPYQSKDTEILGTAGYAAPEQFGFAQTTQSADIYSIGVLINYMAEGVLPGEYLTQGKFRKIVKKCIQMDTKKRYHSVEDIKKELCVYKSEKNFLKKLPGIRNRYKPIRILASVYYIFTLLDVALAVLEGDYLSAFTTACMMLLPVLVAFDFDYIVHRNLGRLGVSRRVSTFLCIVLAYIILLISANYNTL